jgi:FkbM family methyltransferase
VAPESRILNFRSSMRLIAQEFSYRTIQKVFGHRTVMRNVQGVSLAMPWSHRLPGNARLWPSYGQNLVALAVGLGEVDKPLGIIDVGANIGDSAAQILAKVDARVLCVEADPEYLPYLERNVGSDDRCVIAFGLLVLDVAEASGLGAVRSGGTTHFAQDGAGGAAVALAVADLPVRYPELPPIRLIKSDTDGYDTTLIPPLARTYAQSRPVLFFEYDPVLTRNAGKADAAAVWAELRGAGYSHVGIWNNFGKPIEYLPIDEVPSRAAVLDKPFTERGYHYWDVAVVHADDQAGNAAVGRLFTARP